MYFKNIQAEIDCKWFIHKNNIEKTALLFFHLF